MRVAGFIAKGVGRRPFIEKANLARNQTIVDDELLTQAIPVVDIVDHVAKAAVDHGAGPSAVGECAEIAECGATA